MNIDLDIDDIIHELDTKTLDHAEILSILKSIDDSFTVTRIIYEYAYREFVDSDRGLPDMENA